MMLYYDLNDFHLSLFKQITIVCDLKQGCSNIPPVLDKELLLFNSELMITRAIPFKRYLYYFCFR